MNIQLIIPMAGSSEMFHDAGYVGPKWLIEIDGKPMIQHVLDQFPGVTDVLFICNEEESQNRDVVNALSPLGDIVWIKPNSKGPVDTILQAADYIADDKQTVVSYCDHGMVWNFDSFLEEVRDFDGAMTCYNSFHPHMLGTTNLYTFCLQEDGNLTEVQDKQPFTEERKSEFVSSDVFYFRNGSVLKKYFQEAMTRPETSCDGNHFIALVYNLLIEDGFNVLVHKIDKMLLWATPEDLGVYKQWSRYFAQKKQKINKVSEQDFTLILPMSGKGTRFAKEGYELPKPLLPIDGKPMAVQVAECLPRHKNDVFVCLKEHSISDTLQNYFPNSTVRVIDDVTEGYAASCELGIELIDEDSPIMISPCDNGVSYDEQAFLEMVADETNDVIVWSFRNSQASKINPAMYTWMYVDENNLLCDMLYKQVPEGDPLKIHVSIGVMYFRKAKYLLEGLKKNREEGRRPIGELCIDSVAHQLADSDYRVKVFEVDHYACWGTPGDYETYNYWENYFARQV